MLIRRRIRIAMVAAAALQSLILGACMTFRPAPTLAFFGWEYDGPGFFFPSQSGIFLFLLGSAYMAGVWHRPFAWFLVWTKVVAVAFLLTEYFAFAMPLSILWAAMGDGAAGAGVALALLAERQNRRSSRRGREPLEP